MSLTCCTLCPRSCKVDRTKTVGYCGATDSVSVSKAYLHMWEEPCISGKNGSGTVFFSGCQLGCCFCQNYDISHRDTGKHISTKRLGEIFLELQETKAHNINLVTPTSYVPMIIEALQSVKGKLYIPVAYNCGGYESVDTISELSGFINIYMPDIKFFSSEYSTKYLRCGDYFEKAVAALSEMTNQVGKPVIGADGIMKSGVIVRHLVMPSMYRDSLEILHQLYDRFGNDKFLLSLMSQYTPYGDAYKYPEINRKLTSFEYNKVTDCAAELGLEGFCQDKSSAQSHYIPEWNFEGI